MNWWLYSTFSIRLLPRSTIPLDWRCSGGARRCSMPRSAQAVKVMCSRGGAFAQAEPPVGAVAAIVRQYAGDIQRTGRLRIAQKPARIGRRFGSTDADEHPAGGAVVRHEPVETPGFVLHLQQVFDLDVAIERRVGLDELVGGSGGFVHQIRQVSNLVTPQTPIQPRAPTCRLRNSRSERLQAPLVQAQRRALTEHRATASGCNAAQPSPPLAQASAGFAADTGYTRSPVQCSVCAISKPFARAITVRLNPAGFPVRQDFSPDLRRRRGLHVKRNQPQTRPSGTSLRFDLAMKKPEQRGAMSSSGMKQVSPRKRPKDGA